MWSNDDQHQIQQDWNTMAGFPSRVPGARHDDQVDALSPKLQRMAGLKLSTRPLWHTFPSMQALLVGFFILTLAVAMRRVEWWWSVVYQLGAWFLTQARANHA